jgi:pyridinium-3,5-biscarboxylic acid mononucleotide sulfurtransferase
LTSSWISSEAARGALATATPDALCAILTANMKELVQIRASDELSLSAEEKENLLLSRLSELSSLIVALSGGADSAYLAWAAHRALGNRILSITALSPSYSAHDRAVVENFARRCGIRHEFIETHEMENPAYRANAADRCYFCKDELFSALDELAQARGFAATAYGVNADDTLDFRPGHRAATEHQVLAPLLEASLRKAEIRLLSRRAGLPTWDRPASACLASRLPYGTEVTSDRLALVERGEAALRELGFRQFRVRLHDNLARVEIAPQEMSRAFELQMAATIADRLKAVGFTYVSLDPKGYRQGSLNETLMAVGRGSAKTATGT